MRGMRSLCVLLLCLLTLPPAAAQRVYKWTDASGVVHYSDKKPVDDAEVQVIRVRHEPGDIARLRLHGNGAQREAWVMNTLHGPIEVELRFARRDNVQADPPLPLRAVLRPDGEQRVAVVTMQDRARGGGFELAMQAVPGDPAARHDDVGYGFPLAGGDWRLDQGWNGRFSHAEPQSRYAIDLSAPEGTPVRAAREGVVMQLEDGFEESGTDRERFGHRANLVRILHADGSMAIYAHLAPDSVAAARGARVRAGQVIGAVGNTGFSTGPHLHFAVQRNAGMALESVPFRMAGPAGPLAIPEH